MILAPSAEWELQGNGPRPSRHFPMSTESGSGVDVGLHVFHLEKYESSVRGSTEAALRSVLEVGQKEKGWEVFGFSAVCAQLFIQRVKCSTHSRTGDDVARGWDSRLRATGYEEFWIMSKEPSSRQFSLEAIRKYKKTAQSEPEPRW